MYIQVQSSHHKTAWTSSPVRWQKSNSSPARIVHSQNYSQNLREVVSIDDLPFQHGTPRATERETGSGETVLADYESDLESFSPERLISVINKQGGGAPSHHDPNETLDHISEDNLTQDAPKDEDEATRTARRARNQCKGECRVQAAERARLPPRNLNNKFNNVADPVFRTPIAAMTEATLRLMQMPQNPEMTETPCQERC